MINRPNDPFMSLPTSTSSRSQLSPAADVFTPCQNGAPGLASSSITNNGSHVSFGGAGSASHGFPSTHGRVSSLVATSIPEAASYPVQTQYGAVGEQSHVTNLRHGMQSLNVHVEPPHFQNFRDATVADGAFTTDEATTRAFMVTNLNHRDTDFCRIAAQFPVRLSLISCFLLLIVISRLVSTPHPLASTARSYATRARSSLVSPTIVMPSMPMRMLNKTILNGDSYDCHPKHMHSTARSHISLVSAMLLMSLISKARSLSSSTSTVAMIA
jgi:hypothetical protein